MNEDVLHLAQMVAEDHMEGLDYMSVVEVADENDLHLTEGQLAEAHILALKAKVLVSGYMPPSKKRLMDAVDKATTDVIEVVRSGDHDQ